MTKLAQLKAVYDELAKKRLSVGFFEHAKYPDGTPIAYVAAIQELAIRLVAFLLAHFYVRP